MQVDLITQTPVQLAASIPENPPWVLKPFLLEGSIMQLYGRQGLGKSSLMMQLSHSFITGDPWLGFEVQKTGPVLYIQLDMAMFEAHRINQRSISAGYFPAGVVEKFHVTDWEQGFDGGRPVHRTMLRRWCATNKPVAVIIDTINDAIGPHVSGNDDVRELLRKLQDAVFPEALILLNHERKKSKYEATQTEDKIGDDDDAYLGFGAYEHKVAASLQLKRTEMGLQLMIRKVRLDKLGFSTLQLRKDDFGFFHQKHSSQQMLLQWPFCLPKVDQESVLASCTSFADVFRDIAERTNSTFEAVKQQYHREKARGVKHDWLDLFDWAEGA
jgi:RecA-family ATPase